MVFQALLCQTQDLKGLGLELNGRKIIYIYIYIYRIGFMLVYIYIYYSIYII